MAIGWVSLLKTVPWADVIASAPAVADGAKKLWKAVGRKKALPLAAADASNGALISATPEAMNTRLQVLEATVAELQSQMLASSELITALASQNAELVKRAEANRVRLRWLSAIVAALVVLVVFGYWR